MSSLKDALERTKTYNYNDNDQVTKVTMPVNHDPNDPMPDMTFRYVYNSNGDLSESI